jgi:hypothetical protein
MAADNVTITAPVTVDEVSIVVSPSVDSVTVTPAGSGDSVAVTINAITDDVTVAVATIVDDVMVAVTEQVDAVSVLVSDDSDKVIVEVSSDIGPQGPAGADYDPTKSWFGLAVGAVPTGPTAIAGGRVFTYNYGTTTLYRFISTENSIDAFYSGFDGTNLSGLVASKSLLF